MHLQDPVVRDLIIAAALLFGALPAVATPGDPQGMSLPAEAASAASAPLPGGPAPDLDLVFTAQVAGWIEPCG